MLQKLNLQPLLKTARLLLRPLTAADEKGLYSAASDPEIWSQHPAKNRHEKEVFDRYFEFLLGTKGTLIVLEAATKRIIGCSQFYPVTDQPGEIGIGFTFLSRPYWGGQWNREMKASMIAHVLKDLPRVWFHIDPENIRSQVATTRLGAQFAYKAELDLGSGLSAFRCYTLTAADWNGAGGLPLNPGTD